MAKGKWKQLSAVKRFYEEHSNPHNISYTTYIHRVRISKCTKEQALSVQYLGKWGNRRKRILPK